MVSDALFASEMKMLIRCHLDDSASEFMSKASGSLACWFIRDGAKLIQCSKESFDRAIIEGKSVKYRGYANKKSERIAEELETSRMKFLSDPATPKKFQAVLKNPRNVIDVQIIWVNDPQFWVNESKRPKYEQ